MSETENLPAALASYSEALRIFQRLAADYPNRFVYRQDLAGTATNFGTLLRHLGRLPEAEHQFGLALKLYQGLDKEFPDRPDFRKDLAAIHNNLGNLRRQTGRLHAAETNYLTAEYVGRALVATYPDQPGLHNDLTGTCNNLAALAAQRKDLITAETYLRKAKPHHRAALQANPNNPIYRTFWLTHLQITALIATQSHETRVVLDCAETIRDLGWSPSANAKTAILLLCDCLKVLNGTDSLSEAERRQAQALYRDAAIRMLRAAVTQGRFPREELTANPALASIRDHPDFPK